MPYTGDRNMNEQSSYSQRTPVGEIIDKEGVRMTKESIRYGGHPPGLDVAVRKDLPEGDPS